MDTCVAVDCKSDSRLGLKVLINFQSTKTKPKTAMAHRNMQPIQHPRECVIFIASAKI